MLLDGDEAKQTSENKIEDSEYLDQEQVIFVDEVIGEEERAVAIEDPFSDSFFTQLVESYHDLDSEIELETSQPKKLADQAKGEIHRLIGQNDMDLEEFSKGAIADFFDEQVECGNITIEDFDESTRENFRNLLEAIKEQFEITDPPE